MIKHIVQVIPALGFGGAERLVVDLINHSDPTKYRFTVVVFFDNTPLKFLIENKAEVILVDKKSKLDPMFLSRLEKKLRELKPDLIHGHLFAGDFWGRLVARRLKVPFLSTEHNLNYQDGLVKNIVKKIVSGKRDFYAACSSAVSDYMHLVYKIQTNISVIHNGINLNRFINLPLPTFEEPIKFLMVGRLVEQKGQLVALQALNNLKDFSWQLTIVGIGTEKENLLNFIKNNNLSARVQIVEPGAQVEKFYNSADVFLMPSIWEGLGVVVMEAMASGRLVVVSKTGGLTEIVKDQETGLLVASGSVLSLEEKIRYIFANKQNLLLLVKKARTYALTNFGIEKMISKYDELYSSIFK